MSRIMPPVSTAGSGFLDSSTSLSQPTSCSLLQSSSVLSLPTILCSNAQSEATTVFFLHLESELLRRSASTLKALCGSKVETRSDGQAVLCFLI